MTALQSRGTPGQARLIGYRYHEPLVGIPVPLHLVGIAVYLVQQHKVVGVLGRVQHEPPDYPLLLQPPGKIHRIQHGFEAVLRALDGILDLPDFPGHGVQLQERPHVLRREQPVTDVVGGRRCRPGGCRHAEYKA